MDDGLLGQRWFRAIRIGSVKVWRHTVTASILQLPLFIRYIGTCRGKVQVLVSIISHSSHEAGKIQDTYYI
jgi:hypothetical protein